MDGFPVFDQLRLPREQVIEVVIDRSVHIEISELHLTYHRSCHIIISVGFGVYIHVRIYKAGMFLFCVFWLNSYDLNLTKKANISKTFKNYRKGSGASTRGA